MLRALSLSPRIKGFDSGDNGDREIEEAHYCGFDTCSNCTRIKLIVDFRTTESEPLILKPESNSAD